MWIFQLMYNPRSVCGSAIEPPLIQSFEIKAFSRMDAYDSAMKILYADDNYPYGLCNITSPERTCFIEVVEKEGETHHILTK